MATLKVSSLSTEYIRVSVSVTKAGIPFDPTGDTVQMAFPLPNVEPVLADWKASSWESTGGNYWARCLVGPSGTVTLADGNYDVWVKITDSPEIPVRKVGSLSIT